MRVTILSALGVEAPARFVQPPAPVARVAPARPVVAEPEPPTQIIAFPEHDEPQPKPAPKPKLEPAATAQPAAAQARKAAADAERAAREAKQEQMLFEPVTCGRFEKSEPTIVNGEDLDVPTFLRRNLKPR
jgi:cell division protein FtsZ